VTVQNQTIGNLSDFWGVGLNPGFSLDNMTNETEETPINWVVWPAGDVADTFDMTNGTVWTDGVPSQDPTNESQFVAACEAISCHAIFTVPGEIDNPSFAAYEVAYTEQVLHFFPDYWEIGNEPSAWLHFGENWSQWNYTDHSKPSATNYAQVVHAYIAAMKAVDSSLRFIGLPGVGSGFKPDWEWLNPTVKLNGPNLSAVAIHVYPGQSGSPNPTLAKFFGTLTAPKTNMVSRIAEDEAAIKAEEANISCTTCSIQFFVDEFGAGTKLSNFQQYMHTYAEVPYVAAELLMMSESNVSNTELFELRSGFNGSLFNGVGIAFPADSLYTQILPHYDSIPLNTTVTGTLQGVFAGVSESTASNSLTLLAVNTNITQSVQLNVAGSVFPSAGTFEIWRENNSTASPNGTVSRSLGFESSPSWVIPPLGVILVSVCRSNASLGSGGLYPVTFCASGLPAGTSWSVTLGSNTGMSTSGTISFSEPNGTYAYQIGSISGWQTANTSGNVTVNGAPASVQVPWTIVSYPVTFNESGLPTGTLWSVNLSGTLLRSNTTNLTGYESNGTHAYALGIVPGWRPQNATGLVVVNATPVLVVVDWTQVVYNVTFHEGGLPVKTNWSVDLAGSTEYNTTGGPIRYVEPNGTYPYTVGSVVGYTPDTVSGTVPVNGASKYVPLSWAKNSSVYLVQFNETGLPAGTPWNVTLNGTLKSQTNGTIIFYEPNGTYSYSLGGAVGWAPLTYLGNFSVNGTPIRVLVNYSRVTYNVSFYETGLPSPIPSGSWSVTLNGTLISSAGSTISFQEPNGTYSYVIGSEPNYTTNSCSGSVLVEGNSASCTVKWSLNTYSVTFSESGLWSVGGATTWTLNVTGEPPRVNYLNDPPYVEGFGNGTYSFTAVTSIPGVAMVPAVREFTVAGGPVSLNVTFVSVYSVTFVESGLPASTNWSVDLNGSLVSANRSTIAFLEPNGSYPYLLSGNAGYHQISIPYSGVVAVNGAAVDEILVYALVTYGVSFSESGLPAGLTWDLSVNGTAQSLTTRAGTNLLPFMPEPNGTYAYSITGNAGYHESSIAYAGSFTVLAAAVLEPTEYAQVTYTVTFTESGLPAGTSWSVTIGTATVGSTTTDLTFNEPNGTYSFHIGIVSGWETTGLGSVTVSGANAGYGLPFTPVAYAVTFQESGLPSGTGWSVTVGGTTLSSIMSTIQFSLPNGTYTYSVANIANYSRAATGAFAVAGSPVVISENFSLVRYQVTVTETGLRTGTNWSVSIGTLTHYSNGGANVTFQEPNGSMGFIVGSLIGYTVNPSTGSVILSGAATSVAVTFVQTTPSSPSPAGPSFLEWVVVAEGAALVVIGVLFAVTMRRRGGSATGSSQEPPQSERRGPSDSTEEWSEGTPTENST
jgi:hypothetical protein